MMRSPRPRIGLSLWFDYETERHFLKEAYVGAIFAAGGLPVLIPVFEDPACAHDYLDLVDGLMLAGGPDLDARLYGEENRPQTGETSPRRDGAELALVQNAFALDRPVLGICRGHQLLNVAAGGSLFQDLYADRPQPAPLKHTQTAPYTAPTHRVHLEPDSWLARCVGLTAWDVNSMHHQAINHLAPGWNISARASDGIIEAIECPHQRLAVGVQWHPEYLWRQDAATQRLFAAFVDACR